MPIRQWLRRLGWGTDEILAQIESSERDAPDAVAADSAKDAEGASPLLSDGEFERRLSIALRIKGEVAAGQVNFLGLEDVKTMLGERWERMAEQVTTIADRMIEKRLSDVDVFTRVGPLDYLLVFPTLSAEAARLKCGVIGEEIRKRVLGEELGKTLEVAVAVKLVDASTHAAAGNLAAIFEAEKPVRLGRPGNSAGAPADASRYPGAYRPIWDVRQRQVSAYLFVPEETGPDIGDPARPVSLQPSDLIAIQKIDCSALQQVVADLDRLIAANRPVLMGVPVHMATLVGGSRQHAYRDMCARIPQSRGKLVMFELLGVPEGVPRFQLLEVVHFLKPFGRTVLIRASLDTRLFTSAREAGAFAIGAEIGRSDLDEAALIRAVNRFAATAADRLRTYVHGTPSLSVLSSAIGAGIDYIDGDIVGGTLPMPEGIVPLELRDIYRRGA